jgi:Dehydrogenases with different specificities (related to short-chain alcohol dehydrogenases)
MDVTADKRQLENRVVLITGATSGIGLATATALARAGARVVMVSRDPRRGESVRAAINRQTGSDQLEVMQADLASLDSIRALAQGFLAAHERLDVLINDAGVFEPHRRLSADGIEMTLAVNLVAPFLLTSLLLERLRQSAPSRIVNVCSAMQASASLDLDDLQFERRPYRMTQSYGQSKLALLMVTKELARRLQGTGVTVNAAHPGWVATNLGNFGGLVGFGWRAMRPFMISPEEGAKTSVYLALSPEATGFSGGYFAKQKRAPSNPIAEDPSLAARLWDTLESLVRAKAHAK